MRIPSRSQACTVSIVSVWEFPDENVVQTTPSAPSSAASDADASAASRFWVAPSR